MKTDAVDATKFAHLLRTGLLPEAYIVPPELRDVRELLRHRAVFTEGERVNTGGSVGPPHINLLGRSKLRRQCAL